MGTRFFSHQVLVVPLREKQWALGSSLTYLGPNYVTDVPMGLRGNRSEYLKRAQLATVFVTLSALQLVNTQFIYFLIDWICLLIVATVSDLLLYFDGILVMFAVMMMR